MKKIALALAFAFSGIAYAGPAESVSDTVSKMLDILKGANENTKIAQLCSLVKGDIDTNTIGSQLLGTFQHVDDADGVVSFKKLVPSIIMDQFYGLLHSKGGAKFDIQGTVPKGSSKVGVKVAVDGTVFVVTVLKANNKIVDVEWNGFSLVNTKRDEFQRELNGLHTNKPVTALVQKLTNNGVNKCN